MAGPSTFGYWNIAGMANPVRLLLRYVGEDVREKRYDFGPPPEYSRAQWEGEKFTLGLTFPNLPYYINGDVSLTQCLAILHHLASTYGLGPKSEVEEQTMDVLEQESRKFYVSLSFMGYKQDFEDRKRDYVGKTLPYKLKLFSTFLGGRSWLVGDRVTYVDFLLYHALDVHTVLKPDCLDPFPNLKEYIRRFEALPPIKSYLESGEHIQLPVYPPYSNFANSKDYKTDL